jgi:hypothetical protein
LSSTNKHNYFAAGLPAGGSYATEKCRELLCVASRGSIRDRFFEHKENYRGQITFFADEVYQSLCDAFAVRDKPPSVFRRNVITRGVDLNSLVGVEFELQGIRFLGTEECRPCYWMNQAFHRGAEEALRGRGLRARIATSGILKRGTFQIQQAKDLFACGNDRSSGIAARRCDV